MKSSSYAIVLTAAVAVGGILVSADGVHGAEEPSDGQLLVSHHCLEYGYRMKVLKPSGFGGDARMIQVEKIWKSFHTVSEVANSLRHQLPPDDIQVEWVSDNSDEDGQLFCDADGYQIPFNTTVYRVQIRHDSDYNGATNVFYDSNAEPATLNDLTSIYNSRPDGRGEDIPLCPPTNCLDSGSGVSVGAGGSGWPDPGTYTSADGEVHDLFDLCNPNFEICDEPSRPSVGRVDGVQQAPASIKVQKKPMRKIPARTGSVVRGTVSVVQCPYDRNGSFAHRCAEQCSGPNRSWDPDSWKCTVRNGIDPFDGFDRVEDQRNPGRPRGQ